MQKIQKLPNIIDFNNYWKLFLKAYKNKIWTKIEVSSIFHLNLTLVTCEIWAWNCKKKYWEIRDTLLYIDHAIDDLVHPDTASVDVPYLDIKNYGALYTEPVTHELVHPDTTLITIPYLNIKNYGALYAEPVALDLVSQDTTPINIPYLGSKKCGALYIKRVTDDLVHPDTTSVVLP